MKLPETLPSERFQKQFLEQLRLQRFEDASEAWKRLRRNGCDPLILMACLEVYSQHIAAKRESAKRRQAAKQESAKRKLRPPDSYIQEFLETNALEVGEAEKLARDLERDAGRIEQLAQRPTFLRELTWWEERKPNLVTDLRSFAWWLKTTADKIRSPFSLRDQPGQVLNYATSYIMRITGKQSISDLSKLVRAAYAAVGIDDDTDVDDTDVDENPLGKVVRRARKRRR